MIQSMTGFGKITSELPNKKVTIEIKSLNSKQLDLFTRIPSIYKEKEMEIRSLLLKTLERGKVDFNIFIENIGVENNSKINLNALAAYKKQIEEIADELEIDKPTDWFKTLLKLPEVIRTELSELDENEWGIVKKCIEEAIQQLTEFRIQEGKMLENLFKEKVTNISKLLQEIEPYEEERLDKIRNRLLDNLSKIPDVEYDRGRLEQELIFYIEKLDVNEEKNRLANHLKYYIETMGEGHGQGKKLGFIAQEMGREINTLGSKSNHPEMQQIVIRMKDELEQIKEQILNVL